MVRPASAPGATNKHLQKKWGLPLGSTFQSTEALGFMDAAAALITVTVTWFLRIKTICDDLTWQSSLAELRDRLHPWPSWLLS
jgi:hypothetical protein